MWMVVLCERRINLNTTTSYSCAYVCLYELEITWLTFLSELDATSRLIRLNDQRNLIVLLRPRT